MPPTTFKKLNTKNKNEISFLSPKPLRGGICLIFLMRLQGNPRPRQRGLFRLLAAFAPRTTPKVLA